MFGNRPIHQILESISMTEDNRHKIIVGIDYGTTFSGISYVTTEKSEIGDINIISAWPGELANAYWKVPTRIAYKRENPKLSKNKWGFEVHPKLTSYSWTKLLLDKNALVGEYDDPALADMAGRGMMKLPDFRKAEEVCEDFLRELYIYLTSKLCQEMTQSTYDTTPMECWITLPAIWSDEAKDATLNAARKAGFGSRPDDAIFTIAEPEAAAIATLKGYSGCNALNQIKPDDHILICDCGGGTVDITTYTITQVQPCLEFDELCVGVGGKCGSTYIDRNLHSLLSRRFGEPFDTLPFSKKGPGSKFMLSFETAKRDFGRNDDDDDIREVTDLKLDIPDSEFYDEEEQVVKLTYKDIQGLFDPVITEISNLVRQQVKEVRRKKGAAIDRIILVGGFGESPYLNKALAEWCKANGNIKLMRPEHPQSAVVRGAALRGLEGIAPRMKQSRRHYGIGLSLPFREGRDPEEKAFLSRFNNMKYCRHRVKWLISKGDKIFQDTSRRASVVTKYTPEEAAYSTLFLYSTALNDPPEYFTESRVEKVGNISSTFPRRFDFGPSSESKFNTRLNETIHQFRHEVEVMFGNKGENLTCRDVLNGQVVGTATIQFDRH
ncbi:Hsp70 family protein-like protein [Tricladium varicosporioides]|nr:Hsp70 family protein-like protein [Hymenoscyphus varicosporioides]